MYKIILILTFVLMSALAWAHPHIFAKYDVAITQKDQHTLNVHFRFTVHNVVVPHPLFQDLQIENLGDALNQHPFLLFLDLDGQPAGQRAIDLTRSGGTDSEPVYTFDMDIPADTGFGFAIYDPEYYDSIALNGASSIAVSSDSLRCAATSEDVGHTMWGINRAAHIECGDKSKPLPRAETTKKNRFDGPDQQAAPHGDQMLAP